MPGVLLLAKGTEREREWEWEWERESVLASNPYGTALSFCVCICALRVLDPGRGVTLAGAKGGCCMYEYIYI